MLLFVLACYNDPWMAVMALGFTAYVNWWLNWKAIYWLWIHYISMDTYVLYFDGYCGFCWCEFKYPTFYIQHSNIINRKLQTINFCRTTKIGTNKNKWIHNIIYFSLLQFILYPLLVTHHFMFFHIVCDGKTI